MARSTSSSAATTSQATRTRRGPDRVDRGLAVPGHTRLGSRVLDGSGPTNAPVQRRATHDRRARSPRCAPPQASRRTERRTSRGTGWRFPGPRPGAATSTSTSASRTPRKRRGVRLGEDRFEVCCIPFFAYHLALGDVVCAVGERLRNPVRRAAVGQWRGSDRGQATRGRRRGERPTCPQPGRGKVEMK